MGATAEQAEAIHGQRGALQLNLAAVHHKLEEYAEALKVASEVRERGVLYKFLKEDSLKRKVSFDRQRKCYSGYLSASKSYPPSSPSFTLRVPVR